MVKRAPALKKLSAVILKKISRITTVSYTHLLFLTNIPKSEEKDKVYNYATFTIVQKK